MITEGELQNNQTGIVAEEKTEDAADAVTEESSAGDEQYSEWLDKAAAICGDGLKGDIDPVAKQAENIAPVANDLASQLGLEDISGAAALVAEEEEAELNKMDEDSRQYDFTADDVGLCSSEGSFSPALESAWVNVENCFYNVQRLTEHDKDADDLIMAIEQAGTMDMATANKIKERLPGSLDDVNIKMFTKLPSKVGYKLAHEGSLIGKILIGGLIIAGSIYLIYKILTWTIEGIKLIAKIIKRIRERRANCNRTLTRVGNETFDPETMDIDKMAKALFNDPTVEVKAKMKSAGRQPLELRNIKWTATKDFAHLVTPLLVKHLDDIDGSRISDMNNILEGVVVDVHNSIGVTHKLMNEIIDTPGEGLNPTLTAELLNNQLGFANKVIEELKIPINFSNSSNVERLKAVYDWLDDSIKPSLPTELRNAPPNKFISALGDIHFDLLDDEFASQITTIRETLNPKAKKTVTEVDTIEQADMRKEIIKDITVTFMALSNMIRSIYHYTLYIESVIIAEDQFINKVKKFTS